MSLLLSPLVSGLSQAIRVRVRCPFLRLDVAKELDLHAQGLSLIYRAEWPW